jgi:c-di-GMP-binding flagellar brake protein YcgR
MHLQHEQRKYPRLSITSQDYGAWFQIKGIPIQDSRLVNLSAGGCGLEVQMVHVRHLEVGEVLEALCLEHPDLPLVPLSAVILRMLGKVSGKTTGYALVGVEFQGITPFVRDLIADHVDTHLAQE